MLLARHANHINEWLHQGSVRRIYPDRQSFSEWTETEARAIRRKTLKDDIPYILPSIEAWMESKNFSEVGAPNI